MSRLLLLPGLAADQRMYERLAAQGVPFTPAPLLVPQRGETMPAYACRTAAALQLGPQDILGGASFGGLVAAAVARQQPLRALVLIGSTLSGAGLGRAGWLFGALLRLLPLSLAGPLLASDRALQSMFGLYDAEGFALVRAMFAATDPQLLRRGPLLLAGYRSSQEPRCPIFAIHGARDRLLKPPAVSGCRIVADAGHGLAFTHPAEVAALLREALARSG